MRMHPKVDSEIELLRRVNRYSIDIEKRTPSYCAGCPHRGSSSVIMDIRKRFSDFEYMKNVHKTTPVEIISHGGIGCYSLNFLPPFRDMHNMSAMGLGGAAGLGAYPFTRNKHYVMCGDSTFFHSEMSTLSNAIKDTQDILYIILDNKNTAMTGHQSTPGSAYDVMGYKTIEQDIESVVRGMDAHGKVFIRRVNPADRDTYQELLERAFLMDGVRVIIADRECGITYHKKKRAETAKIIRAEGFLRKEKHINIASDVCENCRECTINTGCPGLKISGTVYGEKIAIDQSICVDDTYCTKVKACPSFEQVIIRRSKAPQKKTGKWDMWMKDISEPKIRRLGEVAEDGDRKRTFYLFIPGVGGMGLGFVAKLLTAAGAKEGYRVNYYHQKGLAQRNGAVVSHVLFSIDSVHVSQRIPEGKADLILGLDYLETVRGLPFSSVERTAIICNKAKTYTIGMLIGEDRFPEDLDARIRQYARLGKFFGADYFELSEHYFGNRLYANLMMLGTAYQKGLLPISAETIESVIRETVKKDQRESNFRAFRIGRRLVTHPEMLLDGRNATTAAAVLDEKSARLKKKSKQRAMQYRDAVGAHLAAMPYLTDRYQREFLRRYYDLLWYQDMEYAEQYAARLRQVYETETKTTEDATGRDRCEVTGTVLLNLYKAMAIKDEVWVAHLLTRDEKHEEDRQRYNIDPRRGDSIQYIHINRPHFDLFGKHFEWDMNTRNWMLNIMKRMKFLRSILPSWHRKERAFRDWYADEVVGAYIAGKYPSNDAALEAMNFPFTCTGYREVVYPKHAAAYKRFDELLQGIPAAMPAYIPLKTIVS